MDAVMLIWILALLPVIILIPNDFDWIGGFLCLLGLVVVVTVGWLIASGWGWLLPTAIIAGWVTFFALRDFREARRLRAQDGAR